MTSSEDQVPNILVYTERAPDGRWCYHLLHPHADKEPKRGLQHSVIDGHKWLILGNQKYKISSGGPGDTESVMLNHLDREALVHGGLRIHSLSIGNLHLERWIDPGSTIYSLSREQVRELNDEFCYPY
jgi:hypothetical protein